MPDSYEVSAPVDTTSEADSPMVDSGGSGGGTGANVCYYAGKVYSEGAWICQDGYQYQCHDGSWQGNGLQCSDPNPT